MQTRHVPVMLDEVLAFLEPEPGRNYVDCTIGGGGHTAAILERSAPSGRVLGIDTDRDALDRVKEYLAVPLHCGRLVLVQENFAALTDIVDTSDVKPIHGVLLDLGFSSDQMDAAERGFSLRVDAPLDMRLNQSEGDTAAHLVNRASEEELANIFWRYGEERNARHIARRIIHERAQRAITHTTQLAEIAARGIPYKYGTIHPATRVFQALRIAVNHELTSLETVLPQLLAVLQRGQKGRMVIIAFHSLEDRLVKTFMRREATDCVCPPRIPICICGHTAQLRILTPRPITPSTQEVQANPRARSAKLRAAEVIADVKSGDARGSRPLTGF